MKLSQLIDPTEITRIDGLLPGHEGQMKDPEVASIHYRSDDVRPGGMFFALKGQHADGHRYIPDAISRGASVVVGAAGTDKDAGDAVVVIVENPRKLLAAVSSRFFGNPSEKLRVIGITGTNGKTTTAYLVEHILRENKISAGVISTINYRYNGNVYGNPLTTPESLDLQRILSEMAGAGVTHVVMEVSSHGVAMDRVYHCWFDVAIYTNLSQDHLDFHGNMDGYWSCKKRFFTDYLMSGPKRDHSVAVVNTENQRGKELAADLANVRMIQVGLHPSNDISTRKVRFDQYGTTGEICFPDACVSFTSKLIGRYNLENISCAAGAALALGLSPTSVAQAMASFSCVPGRLESVPDHSGRHIFVDYAHTPEALDSVLKTLGEVATGRLICVFGCGGDRDRAKRPQMGKIAAERCDFVVVTSDNPRTEDPNAIIAEILQGIQTASLPEFQVSMLKNGITGKGYAVEADRERAIHLGISISEPGDTVLIAGKGHENYQIVGNQTIRFDDREKVGKALAAMVQGN